MARERLTTDQSYGIVAAIRDGQDLRFLLVQHRAGHWGFPKGHPEENETPEQAAAREFQEETGVRRFRMLAVPPLAEHYCFRGRGATVAKTVLYFLAWARVSRVRIQHKEIRDHAWLTYDAARERLSFDEARTVLDRAYPHFTDEGSDPRQRRGEP